MWAADRLELIKCGVADPNEEELRQWRRALCRKLAAGSDWCWIAWIVPLWVKQKVAGYALFGESSDADPDGAPPLIGVFANFDEAKAALSAEGAIDGEQVST